MNILELEQDILHAGIKLNFMNGTGTCDTCGETGDIDLIRMLKDRDNRSVFICDDCYNIFNYEQYQEAIN